MKLCAFSIEVNHIPLKLKKKKKFLFEIVAFYRIFRSKPHNEVDVFSATVQHFNFGYR